MSALHRRASSTSIPFYAEKYLDVPQFRVTQVLTLLFAGAYVLLLRQAWHPNRTASGEVNRVVSMDSARKSARLPPQGSQHVAVGGGQQASARLERSAHAVEQSQEIMQRALAVIREARHLVQDTRRLVQMVQGRNVRRVPADEDATGRNGR